MAKGKAAGGKQQQKKTQKVVDDKTFGLKNKNKSKKVQQYVKNVEQQATSGGKKKKAFEEPKKSKKEIEAEKAAEYGKIFKPVVDNKKQEPGVDPKTILCQFFMQGTCKKGNKCRYSHDKTVLRKVNKIDMYTDVRKDGSFFPSSVFSLWHFLFFSHISPPPLLSPYRERKGYNGQMESRSIRRCCSTKTRKTQLKSPDQYCLQVFLRSH